MPITPRDILNETGSAALAKRVADAINDGEESGSIGTLADLTTVAKTNLVAAINEVDAHADTADGKAVTADGKAVAAQTDATLALARQAAATVRLATIAPLPACTYAAPGGGTLTGDAVGQLADIDGVTPAAGDIVLVKDQVAPTNNGIYVVTVLGAGGAAFVLTRHAGFAIGAAVAGRRVKVRVGGTLADTDWDVSVESGADVVGTHTVSFARYMATQAYADAQASGALASARGDSVHAQVVVANGTSSTTVALPAGFVNDKPCFGLLSNQPANHVGVQTIYATGGNLTVVLAGMNGALTGDPGVTTGIVKVWQDKR